MGIQRTYLDGVDIRTHLINLATYFLIQSMCFLRSISLLMLNDVRTPLSIKKESVYTREVRKTVLQLLLETCIKGKRIPLFCLISWSPVVTARQGNIRLKVTDLDILHTRNICVFCIIDTRRLGQRSRYSDSLRAGRFGVRTPVGVRFSAHFRTGPEVHPTSCKMGTRSLTRG